MPLEPSKQGGGAMTKENLAVDQTLTEEEGADGSAQNELMEKLKESIRVERAEIGPLRLKLTISIPREHLDERLGQQYAELKRDALIPGFRKGHAPLRLVEKRFASDVGDQIKTQLVSNGFLAAVEKESLTPLGDPLFCVKVKEERTSEKGKTESVEVDRLAGFESALDLLDIPKEGDFSFSCEVDLKPEFELPDLQKIPVKRPALSVTDENVEQAVQRLLNLHGTYKPVSKGTIKEDDLIYADLAISVDGQTIASEQNIEVAARDIWLQKVHLEGFGDAIKGKKAGAVVSLDVAAPDDHENLAFRGKTVHFEFTIHEFKRFEPRPLDKEFLADVGSESEEELRASIRERLSARMDHTVHQLMMGSIGDYLVNETKMEVPERLSARQAERSLARRGIEMLQQGVPPEEVKKTLDEMRGAAQEQVTRDLKLHFILEKIAEARDVQVSDERLNAAIADIARQSNKRFDRVRDELTKGDGLTLLYHQIRDEQVLSQLLEEAEITEEAAEKTTTKASKKRRKETVD